MCGHIEWEAGKRGATGELVLVEGVDVEKRIHKL